MKKLNLKIKGIHCSSCVKLIEGELQDKVKTMQIEESGKAFIEFDEKKISEEQIKDIIKGLGYQV